MISDYHVIPSFATVIPLHYSITQEVGESHRLTWVTRQHRIQRERASAFCTCTETTRVVFHSFQMSRSCDDKHRKQEPEEHAGPTQTNMARAKIIRPPPYPSTSAGPSHSLSVFHQSISKPDPRVNLVPSPLRWAQPIATCPPWHSKYATF